MRTYLLISFPLAYTPSELMFDFTIGLVTREAVFRLQVSIQLARDINGDIFVCFKAFDKVPHGRLIKYS